MSKPISAAENEIVDIGLLGETSQHTVDDDAPSPPKIFILVSVKGNQIKFEADSGSGLTLISYESFRTLNLV